MALEERTLDDVIAETWDAPAEESARHPGGFQIDTPEQADWAARKIAAIRAKAEDARQQAARYIAPIETWRDEQIAKASQEEAFFVGLLEDFHRRQLEADPKAKSIKLPHGTLKMRAQQPEFEREDAILLQWLKERGKTDYVQTVEKIAWADLKKAAQQVTSEMGVVTLVDPETGEVIEGVKGMVRQPSFSVEVGTDAVQQGN